MTGQQVARTQRAGRGRRVLLSVRPGRSSSGARCGWCKPRLFIMMETEIWPNLLRACRRARRQDGAGQRPDLGALVSALPAGAAVLPPRAADVDRFCMQSEESARRIIDIGADPRAGHGHRQPQVRLARDRPASPSPDRGREPRAALLPHSARRAGDHRRQHAARARKSRSSRLPADSRDAGQRAAHHRAAQAGALRRGRAPRAAARAGAWRAARELRVDAEPRVDVVILDTIGELAQLYQIATRGVRRRQPGRRRRPQHPRARGVRQADRLRPAHAELRRDRRARSSTTRRRPGALGDAGSRPCWSICSAIRCAAPASARRRARWSKPTAARGSATLAAIAQLLPPDGSGTRAAVPRLRTAVNPSACGYRPFIRPVCRSRPVRVEQPLRGDCAAAAGAVRARGPTSGSGCATPSSASAISRSAAAARRRCRCDCRAGCCSRWASARPFSAAATRRARRTTASSSSATRRASAPTWIACGRRAADAGAAAARASSCWSVRDRYLRRRPRRAPSSAPRCTCSTTAFSISSSTATSIW